MRRLITFVLTIAALVAGVNVVCHAQTRSLMTRHVRDVTLNGEAKFSERISAAQQMRVVLVLPLRNKAAIENFLKDLYDPSRASYRQFLTVEEFTTMIPVPPRRDHRVCALCPPCFLRK